MFFAYTVGSFVSIGVLLYYFSTDDETTETYSDSEAEDSQDSEADSPDSWRGTIPMQDGSDHTRGIQPASQCATIPMQDGSDHTRENQSVTVGIHVQGNQRIQKSEKAMASQLSKKSSRRIQMASVSPFIEAVAAASPYSSHQKPLGAVPTSIAFISSQSV